MRLNNPSYLNDAIKRKSYRNDRIKESIKNSASNILALHRICVDIVDVELSRDLRIARILVFIDSGANDRLIPSVVDFCNIMMRNMVTSEGVAKELNLYLSKCLHHLIPEIKKYFSTAVIIKYVPSLSFKLVY